MRPLFEFLVMDIDIAIVALGSLALPPIADAKLLYPRTQAEIDKKVIVKGKTITPHADAFQKWDNFGITWEDALQQVLDVREAIEALPSQSAATRTHSHPTIRSISASAAPYKWGKDTTKNKDRDLNPGIGFLLWAQTRFKLLLPSISSGVFTYIMLSFEIVLRSAINSVAPITFDALPTWVWVLQYSVPPFMSVAKPADMHLDSEVADRMRRIRVAQSDLESTILRFAKEIFKYKNTEDSSAKPLPDSADHLVHKAFVFFAHVRFLHSFHSESASHHSFLHTCLLVTGLENQRRTPHPAHIR